MNRVMTLGTAALVWALFLAVATARPRQESQSFSYQEQTVLTLLGGLDCGNYGVELGASFMLGELKAQEGVIPLMSILKSSPDAKLRIVAALSLCRIGDPRGVFAVKRAATFDDNDRVRATCAWFYNEYVREGTFKLTYSDMPRSDS